MTVDARDPVFRLYRTLLAFGAFAILILAAGLAEFLHFEPAAQTVSAQARIVGIFRYDPTTHQVSGPDRRTFARNEQFAAVVDWSNLRDSITVRALWYDSFENVVGGAGPGHPSALRSQTIIPAAVPEGLKYHLPGEYIFAIERLEGQLPVEVLARALVDVQR